MYREATSASGLKQTSERYSASDLRVALRLVRQLPSASLQ